MTDEHNTPADQSDPASGGPSVRSDAPAPRKWDPALDAYHTASETVGLLPNIRIGDNLIQAGAVAVLTVVGAIAGYIVGVRIQDPPPWACAIIGAVSGMILATFISGFILMILGWVRAISRK